MKPPIVRRIVTQMRFLVVIVWGLGSLTGCGSSNPKVQGRVHFADGTPLTVGKVIADSADGKVGASGYIKEDGTFQMTTGSANDGIPPGKWTVLISGATQEGETHPDRPNPQPIPLIHKKYTSQATSQLSFQVPEQLNWDITVDKP